MQRIVVDARGRSIEDAALAAGAAPGARITQLLSAAVYIGSTYALFALGYALTFGVTGVFNFAHPVVFASGALVAVVLIKAGQPLWLAATGGIIAGGVAGVVLDRIAYWPVRLRAADAVNPLLAGVAAAVLFAVAGVAYAGLRWSAFPPNAISLAPLHAGAVSIGGLQAAVIAIAIVAIAGVRLLLLRTRLGAGMRAVAEHPLAAQAAGVNVEAIVAQTMFVASALGAVSGIAFAANADASGGTAFALNESRVIAQPGLAFQLAALAAVTLGGLGSLTGTIIAAYVVALVGITTSALLPAANQDIVAIAIVLAALAFAPRGLLPKRALRSS